MATRTRAITEALIYWEARDPRDEGWRWRLMYYDGQMASGAWDGLADHPEGSCLQDAIVDLLWQHNVTIGPDDVAVTRESATWSPGDDRS